jgi:hypothetical protein
VRPIEVPEAVWHADPIEPGVEGPHLLVVEVGPAGPAEKPQAGLRLEQSQQSSARLATPEPDDAGNVARQPIGEQPAHASGPGEAGEVEAPRIDSDDPLDVLEQRHHRHLVRLEGLIAPRIVRAEDDVAVPLRRTLKEAQRRHGAPTRIHDDQDRPAHIRVVV